MEMPSWDSFGGFAPSQQPDERQKALKLLDELASLSPDVNFGRLRKVVPRIDIILLRLAHIESKCQRDEYYDDGSRSDNRQPEIISDRTLIQQLPGSTDDVRQRVHIHKVLQPAG